MKRLAISVFILAMMVWFGLASAPGSQATGPQRERAVVDFATTVKLQGVLLRGEYVIVHDEERMGRGEPCTWIYRSNKGQEGKLVLSFHCEHVEHEKAKEFTVRLNKRNTPYEVPEVVEFQFAGSTAGHRVPGA
jgi:hypothetical protein